MPLDIRPVLFAPGEWTPGELEALERHPTERLVTTLLGGLTHDVADMIARSALNAAGIGFDPKPRVTILTGSDYSYNTGRKRARERRSIDLAIVYRDCYTLIADCECKGNAQVNGRIGYCPLQPDGYSDQILCYSHKCMFETVVPVAASLLILPHPKDPRWWLGRADPSDFPEGFIKHAWEVYENEWYKLSLRDFTDCVDAAGVPALSAIICGWASGTGIFA